MDRPTSGGSYRRDPATGALRRSDEAVPPAIADEPAADTLTEAGATAEADQPKRKSR